MTDWTCLSPGDLNERRCWFTVAGRQRLNGGFSILPSNSGMSARSEIAAARR